MICPPGKSMVFLRAPSAFAFSLSLVSCFIFWRRKISTTHCICYLVDGGFRHFGLTNFTLTPPPPLTLFPPVLTFLSPFWTWQFQTAILTTWDHVFLTYFKHAPKSLDTKFLSCKLFFKDFRSTFCLFDNFAN